MPSPPKDILWQSFLPLHQRKRTSSAARGKCHCARTQPGPAISSPTSWAIWEELPKRQGCGDYSVIYSLIRSSCSVWLCVRVSSQTPRRFGGAGVKHSPSIYIGPQSRLY